MSKDNTIWKHFKYYDFRALKLFFLNWVLGSEKAVLYHDNVVFVKL